MPRRIRTLRHWRQQYDPNAEFVWRRPSVFMGVCYKPGEKIPAELQKNKTKLKRFWESKWIELALFDEKTGIVKEFDLDLPEGIEVPDDVQVEQANGSWFSVSAAGNDTPLKLNGKKAVVDFIVNLVTNRAKAAEEAAAIRAELIARADGLGVELTDELLDVIDEEQRVQLETYLVDLENSVEGTRPEFLPEPEPADDDNSALEGADSDDDQKE